MTGRLTYREALAAATHDAMAADDRVVVFGLDVDDHKRIFGSTAGLVEAFGPQRIFGTPLSEDAMTGAAIGAALAGLRPVHVHIRADFLLLAMNQIANVLAPLRALSGGRLVAPLVIRAVIGRGWGQGAQHSKSMHGTFARLPGLTVVMPATPQDAYTQLRAAIADPNPVLCFEHRWLYDIHGEVDRTRTGPLVGAVVRRPGSALTVVAASWMVVEAMEAARALAAHGIEIEVIDVRAAAPLDMDTIVASVDRTRHCLVADYDWTYAGLSAEIAAEVGRRCFGLLRAPVERVGFAPVPCPTTRPLEMAFYPSAPDIARLAASMLGASVPDLPEDLRSTYEHRFKGPF